MAKNSHSVILFYRQPGPGRYSIENVFASILPFLSSRFTIRKMIAERTVDVWSTLRAVFCRADVYHITGAANYFALALPRRKTIITVHDIGHLTNTLQGWKKLVYKWIFWTLPLRRAGTIVTISEFTKEQLLKNFSISPERILVIPNPLNGRFRAAPRVAGRKRILQIGTGAHKNLDRLMEAVEGLDITLILVRRPEQMLIEELNRKRIAFEFRFDLDESELVQCYHDCSIVFFASTYEGFGLPILEGMACGRPVITSAISPMKDVAGSSAILVDPLSVDEIRHAIRTLDNEDVYAHYVELGLKHVLQYDAKIIADAYAALYMKIANGC